MKNILLAGFIALAPLAASASETNQAAAPKSPTVTLIVQGMTCGSCSEKVTEALMKVQGVANVSVDHRTGKAEVTLKKNTTVKTETLKQAIETAGYKVQG